MGRNPLPKERLCSTGGAEESPTIFLVVILGYEDSSALLRMCTLNAFALFQRTNVCIFCKGSYEALSAVFERVGP